MDILISTFKDDTSPLSQDLQLIKTAILYGDKVNLYSHHYSFFKPFLVLQDKNASIEELLHSAFVYSNLHNQENRSPVSNYYFWVFSSFGKMLENLKKNEKKEMDKFRKQLKLVMTQFLEKGSYNKTSVNIGLNDDILNHYLFFNTKLSKIDFPDGVIKFNIEVNVELLNRLKEIHKAIKLGVVNDLYGCGCSFVGIENIKKNTIGFLSKNEMLGMLDERIVNFKINIRRAELCGIFLTNLIE